MRSASSSTEMPLSSSIHSSVLVAITGPPFLRRRKAPPAPLLCGFILGLGCRSGLRPRCSVVVAVSRASPASLSGSSCPPRGSSAATSSASVSSAAGASAAAPPQQAASTAVRPPQVLRRRLLRAGSSAADASETASLGSGRFSRRLSGRLRRSRLRRSRRLIRRRRIVSAATAAETPPKQAPAQRPTNQQQAPPPRAAQQRPASAESAGSSPQQRRSLGASHGFRLRHRRRIPAKAAGSASF